MSRLVKSILIASGLSVALTSFLMNGLGVRSRTVEYLFREENGSNMAVVREDVRWGRDHFYVVCFDRTLELTSGMDLGFVDPQREYYKVHNYLGTSEDEKRVLVNSRRYSVTDIQ
jgi:hypothetical protein